MLAFFDSSREWDHTYSMSYSFECHNIRKSQADISTVYIANKSNQVQYFILTGKKLGVIGGGIFLYP